MIKIEDKSKCCGCEACFNKCPKDAIKMVEDEEGFRYPVIDKDKCINCGLCEKVCQYINQLDNIKTENEIYALTLKDIKKNLSTTVAFVYNVSKKFILDGGIVYSAIYNENMEVVHTRISNLQDLEKIRGSKYVQSKINDSLKKIKEDLKDYKVLFIGTPCQVAGLYKYIGNETEKLYTIDLICYGVPSPKLFKEYVKHIENKFNSKVTNINFRDKTYSWYKPYTRISFKDKSKKYFKKSNDDEWYQIFISHISTRKSCNNCLYTNMYRKSDITVGDFWGIENYKNDIDIKDGVGKLLINTLKGKELFFSVSDDYNYYPMEYESAIRPNLKEPAKENINRKKFFDYYNKNGYYKSYKKYVKVNFYKKIKRKFKYLRKKLKI